MFIKEMNSNRVHRHVFMPPYIYIYIYIYERERERESEREIK